MIGMPIVPVRQRDRARPALPDEPDDVGDLRVGADDAAVGPSQVEAPGGAEHLAGIFGFALALVGRAVRAQLAARQVAEPDAIAARRMDGHGPGQADLDVVGMGAEDEEVYGIDVCQLPTSDARQRSRTGSPSARSRSAKAGNAGPRHSQPPTSKPTFIGQELGVPWELEVGNWALTDPPRARGGYRNCPDKAHHPTDRNSEHAIRTSRRASAARRRHASTSHELSCNEPFTASIQCACEPSWCARRLTKDARTGHFDPR